jgi:hypothetical protein
VALRERGIVKLRHWDREQIRDFVREVKDDVGYDGWNLLVDRLQRALIAEKVLKIVFLQAQMPPKEEIIELRAAMMIQASLSKGVVE